MAHDWTYEPGRRIRAEIPFRNLFILVLVVNGLGWWGTRELNKERVESMTRAAETQKTVVSAATEVAVSMSMEKTLPRPWSSGTAPSR